MARRHPLDPRNGRSGRQWRRIIDALLVPGAQCAYPPCDCPWGRDIDTTITSGPWSGTVDHIVPLVEGGHPTHPSNLQTMHRSCNSRKEADRRAHVVHVHTRTSRQW